MNEVENVQELYPLVKKYNAPIVVTEGGVRFSRDADDRDEWFKTLPWTAEQFWGVFEGVFGGCNRDWYGACVCDIEDTLYALECGWGGY